jgi:DNA-binding Lrp family transcriptional regulator
MSLDLVDKKLLYLLDQNCRQSTTQLAKQLRIHRNVVLYRIKRLEESQVIRGYFTEIDAAKIGYYTFRILFNLSNYSDEDMIALRKFLLGTPQIIWFFDTEGKYDIDIVCVVKTISEFNKFVEELNKSFNRIIDNERISLLTQIVHYNKDYLINKKRDNIAIRKFDDTKISIDEKNVALLYLLSKNAHMNIVDIAKELKISINTVKSRMKQLEKNKIILNYRPFIDTEKSGYFYYKLFLNLKNYTPEDYRKIYSFFELKNSTIFTSKYINGDDIEVEMHLENEKKLSDLKDEMRLKFGKIIKEAYTLKFSKEYIFRYLPENN